MGVDPDSACGIVQNIGQLWLDGQFIDLQIHVEDILFSCNRFILCACSNFLKVLLKCEVKGEGEHPIRRVTIRGISPEIFQLVLKAMYQGENGLCTENVVEFWHAVYQLEIPVLVSKCETFIDRHMTPENFVNIYQNALLLKSTNMIKVAHKFVAKNFEPFKKLDILLQQPVSYIEEIIGDASLVGQSQNHVVEFILKWVNYELCAGEAGPVCADSTAGDLSAQISEVTRNKHDSVEVIFQKPQATFGEDCKRNISGQSLVRKQSLGKLLKHVRFADVSQDSLEMLSDNDLVMGSKEARDIVLQALKRVYSATTSAASIDTEDTVVFTTCDNNRTIYAYSQDRLDMFELLTTAHLIIGLHTHHNKLLCHVMYRHKDKIRYKLNMSAFPVSNLMRQIGYVKNNCVNVGDFCYTFKNDVHMYRTNIEYDGRWYKLFALPKHMPSPSLTVLNDSILYYNSKLGKDGKQEVYCINTKSQKHWHMMTCDFKDCDFVTFIHGDQLYILYGNGMFANVTNSVISPLDAFTLPKYSEVSKSFLLWEFQFKICGAVVHHDNLVVFGDLTSVSEAYECKIPGLKGIQFVHLSGLVTKCHPLVIPKQLLTQRM